MLKGGAKCVYCMIFLDLELIEKVCVSVYNVCIRYKMGGKLLNSIKSNGIKSGIT